MEIRSANYNDLLGIEIVIADAIQLLKQNNVNQWQNGYPNTETLSIDIQNNNLYVVVDNEDIIGVCCLNSNEDPSYQEIYDGHWLTTGRYIVIHRIAVKKEYYRHGIARMMFDYAENLANRLNLESIRIDTHIDNKPMNLLLTRLGYQRCGVIHLVGYNYPDCKREAYEKIIKRTA